jgi:hypothetical protein
MPFEWPDGAHPPWLHPSGDTAPDHDPLQQTVPGDLPRAAALPFSRAAGTLAATADLSVTQLPTDPELDRAVPFIAGRPTPPPPLAATGTAATDAAALAGGTLSGEESPLAALPFGREARRASLSLEGYALICAELTARPGDRTGALSRHGLSESEFQTIIADFSARFRGDQRLQARFQGLCADYAARLTKSRG